MSRSGSAERIMSVSTVSGRDSGGHHKAKSAANRQREKIRQIGEALRQAGFVTLDAQASALGLARSTTWKVLQADHKGSGLRAGVIGCMLAHKELPSAVRSVLREYVIEKARGDYGHSSQIRAGFVARLRDVPELTDCLK
jgi:hypothetical protein